MNFSLKNVVIIALVCNFYCEVHSMKRQHPGNGQQDAGASAIPAPKRLRSGKLHGIIK